MVERCLCEVRIARLGGMSEVKQWDCNAGGKQVSRGKIFLRPIRAPLIANVLLLLPRPGPQVPRADLSRKRPPRTIDAKRWQRLCCNQSHSAPSEGRTRARDC